MRERGMARGVVGRLWATGNTVHIASGTDESVRANPPNPPLPKGGEGGFHPADGLSEQHWGYG